MAVDADPAAFVANPQEFDIPESVIGFLAGELGDPAGGWPEPFRTKALEGRTVKHADEEISAEDSAGLLNLPRATLNRLLFPGPASDFEQAQQDYGDVWKLPSEAFWYGLRPGSDIEIELDDSELMVIGLEAIGEADERGMRTVMGTINGQLRPIRVCDRSVDVTLAHTEKADPANPQHIGVPFAGVVTPVPVEGDEVVAGQVVATIEAMKMEASITAPTAGTVDRLVIATTRQCEGGDLLLVLE